MSITRWGSPAGCPWYSTESDFNGVDVLRFVAAHEGVRAKPVIFSERMIRLHRGKCLARLRAVAPIAAKLDTGLQFANQIFDEYLKR